MGAIEFVCDRESPVPRDEKCPFAIPTIRHDAKALIVSTKAVKA